MEHGNIAALFAGQGVFQRVTAESGLFRDHIRSTFQDIDQVAIERFKSFLSRDLLKNSQYWTLQTDAPELTQLAVFGFSIATYSYRRSCGWNPSVLMGHGFGEIVALVAGGAFSVSEGAQIVCERADVLKQFAKGLGSMMAVPVTAEHAEYLVLAAGGAQASVAAENSDSQTVIAGSYAALESIARLAKTLNIPVKRLAAPYPLHCEPLMKAAAAEMAKRLDPLIGTALRLPVYSPIMGQYYDEIDAPGDSIAEHLIKPIRFLDGVRTLRAHGVDEFVECGVLNGLAGSIGRGCAGVAAAGGLAA
jgi:acyl transferase domain-containing protein